MRYLIATLMLVTLAATAWGGTVGDAVEVRIRSDNGTELPLYPVTSRHENKRVYAEAFKGDNYTIIVRNRLNRRVGIVIAVDGRNIVSGQKSWLKNNERMYLLEPYEEGEYSGWRTSLERINRFYFTEPADSYAAAFKDESAMGVIAVAVYPELKPQTPLVKKESRRYDYPARGAERSAGAAAPAPAAKSSDSARMESESAGTGFGREEYAPAREVAFTPERRAIERIFVKYEWRDTLRRLGVITPDRPLPQRNRMWPDNGFAPYPPGRG
jgi:hypothetical protein